jgi:hypothetical protein
MPGVTVGLALVGEECLVNNDGIVKESPGVWLGACNGAEGSFGGVNLGTAVVVEGLCTEAGFSYVVEGMAVVGFTLGVPGVTVGIAVLGAVVEAGLCTDAGFS